MSSYKETGGVRKWPSFSIFRSREFQSVNTSSAEIEAKVDRYWELHEQRKIASTEEEEELQKESIKIFSNLPKKERKEILLRKGKEISSFRKGSDQGRYYSQSKNFSLNHNPDTNHGVFNPAEYNGYSDEEDALRLAINNSLRDTKGVNINQSGGTSSQYEYPQRYASLDLIFREPEPKPSIVFYPQEEPQGKGKGKA
jgi:hypothetical protein